MLLRALEGAAHNTGTDCPAWDWNH